MARTTGHAPGRVLVDDAATCCFTAIFATFLSRAAYYPQVRSEADEERAGREDATAAVMKMQDILASVRDDMVEAQLASDQYVQALRLTT